MNVLINAYACCPNMGSEPGMAWNWCVNLARYCELHIITESEFREKIENELENAKRGESRLLSAKQAENLHFHFNTIGGSEEKAAIIRKRCWNQGDWRFYIDQEKWQRKTLEIARGIVAKERIDVIHHLNMIGFREPGYLWEIKDIPYVWGPVGAKTDIPKAYLEGAPIRQKLFARLKAVISMWQLAHSSRVHKAAKRASVIVAASTPSKENIEKYLGVSAVLINETGCNVSGDVRPKEKANWNVPLRLLWVGKMDFRKQLSLAIRTVADLSKSGTDLMLHIVGGGDSEAYKCEANKLGVSSLCVWHGAVTHDDVQKLMRQTDLLFFTSVNEGTPHVVLEAIGNGLPVLCFDCCGQGDVVNENVGFKIPLTTPKQSVQDFAQIIQTLDKNRQILIDYSNHCISRAKDLSWDNKAKQMLILYEKAIKALNMLGDC